MMQKNLKDDEGQTIMSNVLVGKLAVATLATILTVGLASAQKKNQRQASISTSLAACSWHRTTRRSGNKPDQTMFTSRSQEHQGYVDTISESNRIDGATTRSVFGKTPSSHPQKYWATIFSICRLNPQQEKTHLHQHPRSARTSQS